MAWRNWNETGFYKSGKVVPILCTPYAPTATATYALSSRSLRLGLILGRELLGLLVLLFEVLLPVSLRYRVHVDYRAGDDIPRRVRVYNPINWLGD